jgi:hypothetical protein
MDDPVANDVGGRDEPVAVGSGTGVLADRERQLGEHRALELGEIFLGRCARQRWFVEPC